MAAQWQESGAALEVEARAGCGEEPQESGVC